MFVITVSADLGEHAGPHRSLIRSLLCIVEARSASCRLAEGLPQLHAQVAHVTETRVKEGSARSVNAES